MQADLDALKRTVIETAKHADLADDIVDVSLESDESSDGGEFLRVVLQVRQASAVTDDALETLLLSIERELGVLDERYASVRFSETV